MSNGGKNARKGFIFQDFASGFYFIRDEDVQEINIEKYDDFSYFKLAADPPVRHFFQVKSSKQGTLKWSKFKNSIAPIFYDLSEKFYDEDEVIKFHIVANYKPHKNLQSFLEDVDRVRRDQMQVPTFRTRWDDKIRVLEEAIERVNGTTIESDVLNAVFGGLSFDFHSKKELEREIESFLNGCQQGRTTAAKRTILNKIHETESATISKRDVESEIGFRLEQLNQSTSYSGSSAQIRGGAEEVHQRYSNKSVDISQPSKDQKSVSNYVNFLGDTDADQIDVETAETTVMEGLSEAEEAKRQYRTAIQKVTSGLEHLFEVDTRKSTDEGDF